MYVERILVDFKVCQTAFEENHRVKRGRTRINKWGSAPAYILHIYIYINPKPLSNYLISYPPSPIHSAPQTSFKISRARCENRKSSRSDDTQKNWGKTKNESAEYRGMQVGTEMVILGYMEEFFHLCSLMGLPPHPVYPITFPLIPIPLSPPPTPSNNIQL